MTERFTNTDLIEQREARLDSMNYDTPNNPLTGTDQGEWPGGDSPEISDGQWSLAMEGLQERRKAFLRQQYIETLEDI